ncbi:SpoIIE family protein phosphatase [Azospirillum ramasamyi]|uniref:HAMP domain-containing protein n=1 Tax=Azospirillum ramasamyi TaxID=682998 RepID=A0A2U9S9F3_9PROT|nr:SpoIIE family protein phosphatase [Azospirillum ramasamyi]AWU96124.1 hypothetical protein DM194_17565 [Azospirillum ramasamyi]
MSVTGWDDTESYTLRGTGPGGTDEDAVTAGGSSLLTRVILMIVGCTLLVGLVAMGVSSLLVGRQQREAVTHRAMLVGTLQASAMGQAVWEFDTRAVEGMIRGLMAEDPAVRSVKVWAASGGRGSHGEPLVALDRPAGRAELTTVERQIAISGSDGERNMVGLLRLTYSLEEAESATMTALAPMAGLVFFSLLAVIGMISILLNRLVLAPLARLTRSAGAIAAGDYRVRLRNRRADEIGQLTVAFNHMAETVHDYTERLEQRVAERTEELRQSNEQLAVVNRQVMDSIQYASLLQSAILPDEREMARRLDGVCVLWRPRDVVGGDFHIFRELEDGRFLIGVADCSGHGVPGAFMTMTVSAILDHVLSDMPDSDPAAILGRLNRMVRAALARGRDNPRFDNGLDIGLCLVRPDRGDLLFAGGRIGLHIVDAQDGAASVNEVKGDAQSLGYRRSDIGHRFTTHRVELAPGRSFYLTTDGFLDQAGGARGFGFGNRRFNAMLLEHDGIPMADRKAAFAQALADHQGDRAQRDDITLIGFSLSPAPAAAVSEAAGPSSHFIHP